MSFSYQGQFHLLPSEEQAHMVSLDFQHALNEIGLVDLHAFYQLSPRVCLMVKDFP